MKCSNYYMYIMPYSIVRKQKYWVLIITDYKLKPKDNLSASLARLIWHLKDIAQRFALLDILSCTETFSFYLLLTGTYLHICHNTTNYLPLPSPLTFLPLLLHPLPDLHSGIYLYLCTAQLWTISTYKVYC